MTNLFQIKEEYLALLDQIIENDGVIDDNLEAKLNVTVDNMHEKCHAYRSITVTLQGENDVISDEIKRLEAIKKRNCNTVELLQNKVLSVVIEHGEFSHDNVTFKKRTSRYVDVLDADSLDPIYQKTEVKPDKKAIMEDLKNGVPVAGCELKERNNLVMK